MRRGLAQRENRRLHACRAAPRATTCAGCWRAMFGGPGVWGPIFFILAWLALDRSNVPSQFRCLRTGNRFPGGANLPGSHKKIPDRARVSTKLNLWQGPTKLIAGRLLSIGLWLDGC